MDKERTKNGCIIANNNIFHECHKVLVQKEKGKINNEICSTDNKEVG